MARTGGSLRDVAAIAAMVIGTIAPAAAAGVSVHEQPLPVTHVVIRSAQPYAVVKARIETLGRFDDKARAVFAKGDVEAFRRRLTEIAGPKGLAIHYIAPHGDLSIIEGKRQDLIVYYIGNVLSAEKMTKADPAAGLYAPLRVAVYADPRGGTTMEYDKPSTLFGQYRSAPIDAVAKSLDERLLRVLTEAGS